MRNSMISSRVDGQHVYIDQEIDQSAANDPKNTISTCTAGTLSALFAMAGAAAFATLVAYALGALTLSLPALIIVVVVSIVCFATAMCIASSCKTVNIDRKEGIDSPDVFS